ncbi:MAG: hypothetical protein BMS9Abin07_2117 [Acidimicrobiia bacterium]|nr:MAG: hypothetical protein BMS9Abin07_2117 [Acidimicrobiia bacterium]
MYEMLVDSEWVGQHGLLAEGIETWFVADPQAGFAPNVNVLTQVAGVPDMETYLELSIESGPALMDGFELLREDVLEGEAGQELGVMEYAGSAGGRDLRFLGVFILVDGRAIVATFTAPEGRYDDLIGSVEPYLVSLRPTGDA